MNRTKNHHGYTLIELLVSISIISLLLGLLFPTLGSCRRSAMLLKAHVDLRSITQALDMYRDANHEALPPTRFSCSSRTAYELPVELMYYLPFRHEDQVDVIDMPDAFDGSRSYCYRAVGTAILNEYTVLKNKASLWVPDGFPNADNATGKYYYDPELSPVRYAVWSMGPEPESPLFDTPGRLPLPSQYWLTSPVGEGVVVHFEDDERQMYMSP